MKKILPMTGLALILLGAGAPALAQGYDYSNKNGEDILSDARYSNQRSTAQTGNTYRATQTAQSTQAQSAARVEPAAGNYASSKRSQDEWYEDFTGPYVGADIGYNIGTYETDTPAVADGDLGVDGWEGGLFAGYGFDQNFLPWLGGYAGLELGYEWSGADGSFGATGLEKDHAILATFRPGITMHKDAMAYGIVGWSYANFEAAGDDEYLNGLVLGAGSEFDTRSPVKIRLEYTYTNYEDDDVNGISFDGHENQVKVGTVMRF